MVVKCTAYIITAYFPGPAMTYSIPSTLSNPVMAIVVIRLLTCGIPLTGILLRLCYSSGNHGGQHTSAALYGIQHFNNQPSPTHLRQWRSLWLLTCGIPDTVILLRPSFSNAGQMWTYSITAYFGSPSSGWQQSLSLDF